MASEPPPPTRLQPKLWKLTGVRIFPTGKARGQTWTESDIDAMVSNGRRFGHLVRPTVVIGHEEKQPLTDGLPATAVQNTGEPAFGRVVGLRKEKARDGTFLTADFHDMPGWLAKRMAGRQYIDRSAEVYDTPPDGLEAAEGPILRRVALLGGELPQWKTLGELPEPEVQSYAEARLAAPKRPLRCVGSRHAGTTSVVTFSERPVKKCKAYADYSDKSKATFGKFADAPEGEPGAPEGISRQDTIDALADAGVDVSAITDAVPDEALAEWVRSVTSQASPEPQPEPPAAKPADSQMDDSMTPTTVTPPTTDMAAKHPASVTLKYSENGKAVTKDVTLAELGRLVLGPLNATAQATADLVARQHGDAKRAGLESFCEAQIKAGKMLPAERDAGLLEMAMGLDAVTVQKFSDGKSQTQLDRWKATIEARPSLLSYAERLKGGPADAAAKDADEATLKGHFSKFSEQFRKTGLTEEKLLKGFQAEKKLNPDLTATEFLGQAA